MVAAETGIELALGSVGGSYENALAGTVIGSAKKIEVFLRPEPWRSVAAVEIGKTEWLEWHNAQHP